MAVERWRVPLLGIVMVLMDKIGLEEGVTVERLSKPLHRSVLRILRSAESAVRRLIFVAARNIVLEPRPKGPPRPRAKVLNKAKATTAGEAKGEAKRRPSFKLFDPSKRQGRRFKKRRRGPEFRITFFDDDPRRMWERFFAKPQPAPVPEVEETVEDDTVNAGPLIRRLMAIVDALQDIERQAKRLALWRAEPVEDGRPERWSPFRVGRPPGYRQRPIHEVDAILKECDWLARNVMPPLDDTS